MAKETKFEMVLNSIMESKKSIEQDLKLANDDIEKGVADIVAMRTICTINGLAINIGKLTNKEDILKLNSKIIPFKETLKEYDKHIRVIDSRLLNIAYSDCKKNI